MTFKALISTVQVTETRPFSHRFKTRIELGELDLTAHKTKNLITAYVTLSFIFHEVKNLGTG